MDARRRRLLYRATHRGMKEADVLIGGFAQARLADLSQEQVSRLEGLLDEPDADLLDWLMEKAPVPAERDTDVFRMIRAFRPASPKRSV